MILSALRHALPGRAAPGLLRETLAQFRPSLAVLARLQAVRDANQPLLGQPSRATGIPGASGRLTLRPRQRWLDLRALETREDLRATFAPLLQDLGLQDFDVSTALGPTRRLTQAIARWAYEQDYHGIVYTSRVHEPFACWAIFDTALFHPTGPPEPIRRDDPDLRAIARVFGLL